MSLVFTIAKRYLFSKKSQNAINIVSFISVCGVAVGTMALICVLSVFNGFQGVVESLFSDFDPQLKITAAQGKVFNADSLKLTLKNFEQIQYSTDVLQDNALLKYKDKQVPVVVKGVDSNYSKVNNIDSILVDGEFILKEGSFNLATSGIGLARTVGFGVHFVDPLWLYAPKRKARVNMLRPDKSFNREPAFLTAIFMVQQEKYDNNLLIVPIDMTRKLFDYKTEVTAIDIKLNDGIEALDFQSTLQSAVGDKYLVKNRYEQQEDFFRMLKVEKWVSYFILSFILLIAVFNVIGSLSMLIIDKKDDIITLKNLGASNKLICRIFLLEGWLISLIGAVIGLILGLVLCYIQMEYGIIGLGGAENSFIVNAYPVQIEPIDIILVFITVISFGFLAAFYPAKQTSKNI